MVIEHRSQAHHFESEALDPYLKPVESSRYQYRRLVHTVRIQ